MNRLTPIDPATATGKAKTLLAGVQSKRGLTPNMMRMMANGPAVLDGYLAFAGALAGGSLDPDLRERVALTVAEANACEYCLSAHSLLGRGAGLGDAEITAAREAKAADPRIEEALRFARLLVTNRGEVASGDIARLRASGFSDGAIAELVANVALNIFTNYFNHVAQPAVDFPVVKPHRQAAA